MCGSHFFFRERIQDGYMLSYRGPIRLFRESQKPWGVPGRFSVLGSQGRGSKGWGLSGESDRVGANDGLGKKNRKGKRQRNREKWGAGIVFFGEKEWGDRT